MESRHVRSSCSIHSFRKFQLLLTFLVLLFGLLPIGLVNGQVKVKVEQKERATPSHCVGASCPLVKIEQVYYVGEINIGSNMQPITVMFDTGSSILWVTSSLVCRDYPEYCRTHNTYDHSTSDSYVKVGTEVNIEYVDSAFKGFVSKDDVTVAGYTIKGQSFAEVTHIDSDDDVSSGVFGLGLLQNGAPDPPFINMHRQGLINDAVFAFYFDRSNRNSELLLGAADDRHFKHPMSFVPVPHPSSHWKVKLDRILVNQVEIQSPNEAILDSGCTHIAGPSYIIDEINRHMGTRDEEGMVYFDCAKLRYLPVVTIEMNSVQFHLKPDDYVTKKNGYCESGFTAADGLEELVLGNVWMTAYYTLFDVGRRQIGFARAKA